MLPKARLSVDGRRKRYPKITLFDKFRHLKEKTVGIFFYQKQPTMKNNAWLFFVEPTGNWVLQKKEKQTKLEVESYIRQSGKK